MAARYLVGSGTWDASNTAIWAASSGGASGASAPTLSDDVVVDGGSPASPTLTVATGAVCRDFTATAPVSGNLTLAGSGALTCYGSWSNYGSMVRTFTGTITFRSTATGKTITTNGVLFNSSGNTFVFNGVGGGWALQDNLTVHGFTLTAGALDLNGFQLTEAGNGSSSIGASTRSLTFGTGTLKSSGGIIFANASTGLTISCASGTVDCTTFQNANTSFNTGDHSYGTVLINCTVGSPRIGNNNGGSVPTIATLTMTGTTSKLGGFDLYSSISGTAITIAGNSSINRLIIGSTSKGTQRTLTFASVTVSNADFQDIIGAGAGSWNLSAITGLSGDCGGNSGITFTPPATQYWQHGASASYNWSDSTRWFLATNGSGGAGRVPLPQDSARFDANSFAAPGKTVVQDMPRIGTVDWTGVTNTPTWTTSTTASFFGSITLASGLTLTASSQIYTYEGRGSSVLTSAGKTWSKEIVVEAPGGTLTLGDALVSTTIVRAYSGTFNSGNFSVTCSRYDTDSGRVNVSTFGSSTVTVNDYFGASFGSTTITPGTYTIRFVGALAAPATFYTGARTYYNLEIATTGAFAFQLIGANATAFNSIYIDASLAARSLLFTAGSTVTVASMTRDAGTNVITLGSITAANHNLVKSGGGVIKTLHHMSISRSQATPGTLTWYANIDSIDGGNNSGWIFGVIPPGFTTTSTVAAFNYVAKAATTSSRITRAATAAMFSFLARPGITSSTITRTATVASFLFRSASALARSAISIPSTAASFAFNAIAGSTSTTNPDPRNIPITVSLSANPAIVVSRSSYSITVSE